MPRARPERGRRDLASVPGIGPALADRIRDTIGIDTLDAPPSVAELLDVDREYREAADAGDLPTIAPRRNSRKASAANPKGGARPPILTRAGAAAVTRPRRDGVANTDRAHDLGATDDWVVVYEDAPNLSRQWTVVTARHGDLDGRRVVRGREREMREHYGSD